MISTIRQVLFINTLKPQPMQCFGAMGLDIFPIFFKVGSKSNLYSKVSFVEEKAPNLPLGGFFSHRLQRDPEVLK